MEGMAKMHKDMDEMPKMMKTNNPSKIPCAMNDEAKKGYKCSRNKMGQME